MSSPLERVVLGLPDALHARPANLLVKLSSRFAADVRLRYGAKSARAKNILEVLALGAPKGAEIVVEATGADAAAACEELSRLVDRNFDQALVPDHGSVCVEGIAIGTVVSLVDEGESAGAGESERALTTAEALALLDAALSSVTANVNELVRVLPRSEAELFEPEVAILESLTPLLRARVSQGELPSAAVRAETQIRATDLVLDVRVRLLRALANESQDIERRLVEVAGDVIVVTDELTPSLVARLPQRVVGILAIESEDDPRESAGGFFTSHAALLARGRGLPLAMIPSHVGFGLEGDVAIVDTTASPARVWSAPSALLLADAKDRRAELVRVRESEEKKAAVAAEKLGVAVRVNIGSTEEAVPAGAHGIGLVRTELVFAAETHEPDHAAQVAALSAIVRRARGAPVVVRLYDAGGDKPLAWLPPPSTNHDARGVELLLQHPTVLAAQLRAIAEAGSGADVRVLIPLVRDAKDIDDVRRAAPSGLAIGAMVETKEAVAHIAEIAAAADFLSIGTNDLTASVTGKSREHGTLAPTEAVLDLVKVIATQGHAAGKKVTVCGEFAASVEGARTLIALGIDAISVPPPRFASLIVALGTDHKKS